MGWHTYSVLIDVHTIETVGTVSRIARHGHTRWRVSVTSQNEPSAQVWSQPSPVRSPPLSSTHTQKVGQALPMRPQLSKSSNSLHTSPGTQPNSATSGSQTGRHCPSSLSGAFKAQKTSTGLMPHIHTIVVPVTSGSRRAPCQAKIAHSRHLGDKINLNQESILALIGPPHNSPHCTPL